jgi:anti-anti-sigma factor
MDDFGGFSIDAGERGGRFHVVPRGELDMATTPELEELVLARLREGQTVVLDLRELEFMDSSGVRALISAHTTASEGYGDLVLVRPPAGGAVHRIIEISGLDEELGWVDDA